MAPESDAVPAPGLMGSARRLVRTALGLVATRLQILGTEVEEEQYRFLELVTALAAMIFCFGTAVILGVLFVVVLLWDTHRLATLGVFTVLFAAAGVAGLAFLKRRRRRRQRLFAATLGEIAKDLERMRDHA